MMMKVILITLMLKTFNTNVVGASTPSLRNQIVNVNGRTLISENDTKPKPRIIGGTPVSQGSYPSYAIPITGGLLCGATLIHDDILISAAHCAGAFKGNDIAIGPTVINGADATEVIRATNELVYPNFSETNFEHDILLIQLEKPSKTAPVVTWNDDSTAPSRGDTVRVIGFGRTVEEGDTSDNLLEVSLQIIDHETCSTAYDKVESGPIVESSMICAGPPSDSQDPADSCQGDSGGPLFNSDNALVGIVSFGYGCGRAGIPGIYTRVSSVSEFITNGICQLSAVPPSYCGNTDDNTTTDDNTNDDSSPNNQCTDECTVAWVVPGLIVRQGTGSSCTEACVVMFLDSYLSGGYECGRCE